MKNKNVDYLLLTTYVVDVQPLNAALKSQDGKAVIKIKVAQKTMVLSLSSPSKKPLQHTESEKDGYTILTFNANSYPFVYLNKTKSKQDNQYNTIGKFYIEQQ
jgi:hypothetical protein